MRNYGKSMYAGYSANSISASENRTREENFWTRLAAEIVIAAVADWRYLVKHKVFKDKYGTCVTFDELRGFFRSDWCDFLMQDFDMEAAALLEILEDELAQAMQKEGKK